jgi:hypothetical protein
MTDLYAKRQLVWEGALAAGASWHVGTVLHCLQFVAWHCRAAVLVQQPAVDVGESCHCIGCLEGGVVAAAVDVVNLLVGRPNSHSCGSSSSSRCGSGWPQWPPVVGVKHPRWMGASLRQCYSGVRCAQHRLSTNSNGGNGVSWSRGRQYQGVQGHPVASQ